MQTPEAAEQRRSRRRRATFRKIVDENKNEAKILSIIFYKNIHSQDYNLTDKKSGVLYSIVNGYRRRKLHDKYFISLDKERDNVYNKLEELKKEKASSAADVRKEIICRFLPQELWSGLYFSDSQWGRYHGKQYLATNLWENEAIFLSYFGLSSKQYVGYDLRNQNSFVNFEIDTSNVIGEYKERSKLVSSERINEYKKTALELDNVNERIRLRNSITIADLISKIGEDDFQKIAQEYIDKCDDPDIIDKQQLETIRTGFERGGFEALYYLLTNGYIMQDYMMFRSIFHEGTISVNDNDYIKAVGRFTGCNEVNESFSLDDEKDVLAELVDQNYIYREGAIHHQLVTYMMNQRTTEYNRYLSGMISKIFERNVDEVMSVFKVLDSKFIHQNYFAEFIALSLEKNSYLDRMLSLLDGRESDEIQIKIILNMIAFVDPHTSADTEQYRKFVEDTGYQLISHLNSQTFRSFMDNILKLGVAYDDVSLPVTDMEHQALRFIADNEMYRFDKANYRAVVAGLIPDDKVTSENVDARPLSLVTDFNLENVKAHIDSNIDVFAREIFIGSEENSETIVSLLLHPSLSGEVKAQILEKMQFTVPDLTLFREDVDVEAEGLSWHDLFYRYDHVEPGWPSLLAYMYEECNISVLTGYIEKHALPLSGQHVELTDGDKYEILYRKVICNDELSDSAYGAVLKSLNINTEFWDEKLSFSNFRRIVENNRVTLNAESFIKATDRFGALTDGSECETFLSWFTQYKDEFLSDTDLYLRADGGDAFLEELLAKICRSADFSVKEKAELLLKYNTTYNESFLDSLKLSGDVIKEMIKISRNDSQKISLIISLLFYTDIRRSEVSDLVAELDDAEYKKLFSQQTATLALSNREEAESFMSALQERELIVEWSVREDGKYFVICRRKSRPEDGDI